jgi:hypothetical protein
VSSGVARPLTVMLHQLRSFQTPNHPRELTTEFEADIGRCTPLLAAVLGVRQCRQHLSALQFGTATFLFATIG